MIDASRVTAAIQEAAQDVLRTMLHIDRTTCRYSEGSTPSHGGVVSLVGLTGHWSGTGTLFCSPTVAGVLAARMLLHEESPTSVDEEVLDAVAELTNMIVGNIKNLLASEIGEMAISIPTVIYGRNFRYRHAAGTVQSAIVVQWEEHSIEVKVCLAPTEHNSILRQRLTAPAFCAI